MNCLHQEGISINISGRKCADRKSPIFKGEEKNPSPAPVADRGNPQRGLGAPLQFPLSN